MPSHIPHYFSCSKMWINNVFVFLNVTEPKVILRPPPSSHQLDSSSDVLLSAGTEKAARPSRLGGAVRGGGCWMLEPNQRSAAVRINICCFHIHSNFRRRLCSTSALMLKCWIQAGLTFGELITAERRLQRLRLRLRLWGFHKSVNIF